MNLDKIDLKNIHKIVGEMVGAIQKEEMSGGFFKTMEEAEARVREYQKSEGR